MKPPKSIFRSRKRWGVRDDGPTPACSVHQWLSTLYRDEAVDGTYYDYQCRLCSAIGIECQCCLGSGDTYALSSTDPSGLDKTKPKEVCPRCAGKGIIEIVEITLAEVQRLRAKAGEP